VRILHPELWLQKNWLLHQQQHTITHFLFHQGNFDQQHDRCLTTTLPFSVSLIEDKLKGHHFDTTGVINAESQAVLNTLTEHDFQDIFKKWQKH
jgi:hypothetical protein